MSLAQELTDWGVPTGALHTDWAGCWPRPLDTSPAAKRGAWTGAVLREWRARLWSSTAEHRDPRPEGVSRWDDEPRIGGAPWVDGRLLHAAWARGLNAEATVAWLLAWRRLAPRPETVGSSHNASPEFALRLWAMGITTPWTATVEGALFKARLSDRAFCEAAEIVGRATKRCPGTSTLLPPGFWGRRNRRVMARVSRGCVRFILEHAHTGAPILVLVRAWEDIRATAPGLDREARRALRADWARVLREHPAAPFALLRVRRELGDVSLEAFGETRQWRRRGLDNQRHTSRDAWLLTRIRARAYRVGGRQGSFPLSEWLDAEDRVYPTRSLVRACLEFTTEGTPTYAAAHLFVGVVTGSGALPRSLDNMWRMAHECVRAGEDLPSGHDLALLQRHFGRA